MNTAASSLSLAEALAGAPTRSPTAGHWLEVVSHLEPRYGGLSAAVPALSATVESTGAKVSIAAFCAPNEEFSPAELQPQQTSFWPTSRKAWLLNKNLRANFAQQVRGVDGLHLHGLWEQSTTTGARLARRLRKPYVLSAHGMLEPWALAQRRLKKWVYAQLLERSNVRGAGCLHALTLTEAQQYRDFGADGPIVVIPNGVNIAQDATAELLLERFPALVGRRVVLYLGRLHEKKGLDLLLAAWASVAGTYADAHLVLAGPDADGTRARLDAVVARKELGKSVLFTGMLEAGAKWSALAASMGFVLPSHSEGLSVGVLEAMGKGVPVLITENCNMPQVAEHGAGWVIPASETPLIEALHAMLRNSSAENKEMGARGRALVQKGYTWPVVAQQMAEVYMWLEGKGAKPQGMPFFDKGEPCQ